MDFSLKNIATQGNNLMKNNEKKSLNFINEKFNINEKWLYYK